mgnify:FL=1
MQTVLLIPTAHSIGLTSACLGVMHALDSIGIKAGFMKPFSQSTTPAASHPSSQADAPTLARASAIIQNAFGTNPPPSISRQSSTNSP